MLIRMAEFHQLFELHKVESKEIIININEEENNTGSHLTISRTMHGRDY